MNDTDCQICRRQRPAECLFTLWAPIVAPGSSTRIAARPIVTQQIRYCNDNDECAAGANSYLWSGGAVPMSRLALDTHVQLATERWLARSSIGATE